MAAKSILYRTGLGRELTFDEVDENFRLAEQGTDAVAFENTTILTHVLEGTLNGSIDLQKILLDLDDTKLEKMYNFKLTVVSATGMDRWEGHIYVDRRYPTDDITQNQWTFYPSNNLYWSGSEYLRHSNLTVKFKYGSGDGSGAIPTDPDAEQRPDWPYSKGQLVLRLKGAPVIADYKLVVFEGIKDYYETDGGD